jgi:diketogulonate reductase-like aldo/keto reductase
LVALSQVSGYSSRNKFCRDNDDLTRVTPAQIRESVDKSLQRLQTDHVDLLQVAPTACAGWCLLAGDSPTLDDLWI